MTLSSRQRPPRRLFASFLILFSCITPFSFGAEPDADSKPDPKPDSETVVLSPFQVDASKNQGYRATSTLAGSRINTDLKNVANAVTVVTKDFFNDVAAVDINDILSYTPGTEGVGQFVATENVLGSPDDLSAANRQTSNRIRGLAAADIARDYFATITSRIGFDTYNLDEVTINRGPNSVLFGQGSASGLINYSPQLANLAQSTNEFTFRYGSFNDQRATFNVNVAAKPNVFAVRVAGVWNDHGFKQQPASDRDRRIYAAVTYKPFSKTTVRANYEHVKRTTHAPNSFTPADYVTPWLQAGSPTVDLSTSVLPADARETLIYNKNGTFERAIQGLMVQEGTVEFAPPRVAGFYVPGLRDNRYFDLENINLYNLSESMKTEVFSLALDQEILPKLYLNLAYLNETFDNTKIGNFRTPQFSLRIDNVTKFQNGEANPHFGELYFNNWGANSRWSQPSSNAVGRATLSYELDLRNRHKWLGRYTLTGFAESRSWEQQANIYGEHSTVDPTFIPVNRRYYLGGSATTPATGRPPVPTLLKNAAELHYDAATGKWVSGTVSTQYVVDRLNEDISKLNTRAFVGQAYLFDERIVGTVGVRHDVNSSKNRNGPGSLTVQKLPDNYGEPLTAAKQTVSYGVVAHPLPWLSLHYSKSENFKPAAGTVDLQGNSTPSPEGTGKDYGFSVNLFQDKLNLKVNWFEMAQKNDFPGQTVRILAQWQLPFAEYGVIGPLVEQQLNLPYKYIDPAANHIIWGDGRLENGSYTADSVAKGIELELTYNVTKNWRIMANVTKQEARRANIAPGLTTLVEERLAYWKSIPGLLNTLSTTNPWGVAWTGQDAYNSVLLPYLQYKAQEGQPSNEISKYRFNFLTNYSFSEGKLRGFNVGGGVRLADRPVIGNPYLYQAGVTGPVGLDLAHPFRGEREIGLDAWAGYTTKIMGDKYRLTFQLNARDLASNGGLEVISAAGLDASGKRVDQNYRIKTPRSFYLTTKVEF